MRGDGVGVGDVGEVPRGARSHGHTTGGDDGWGPSWHRICWLVRRLGWLECFNPHQSSSHRLAVPEWNSVAQHSNHHFFVCNSSTYLAGTSRADGMRGDGLGVADDSALYDGKTWSGRDASGGDDGGGSCWERDARVVGGHGRAERGTTREPGGDGIGIDDGTRGQYGDDDVYSAGAGGADGMRGDGVGVGDVGEVPCGTRCRELTSRGHVC